MLPWITIMNRDTRWKCFGCFTTFALGELSGVPFLFVSFNRRKFVEKFSSALCKFARFPKKKPEGTTQQQLCVTNRTPPPRSAHLHFAKTCSIWKLLYPSLESNNWGYKWLFLFENHSFNLKICFSNSIKESYCFTKICQFHRKLFLFCIWASLPFHLGVSKNYVDKMVAFFHHLPTPGWHFWRNFMQFV